LSHENNPDYIKFESKYKDGDCPEPAADFDLHAEGQCTPIKSQGSCGSCVIFANTAAMEQRIKTKYGHSTILAE